MHSFTTYLLHYLLARSLFDALFGHGHALVLLVAIIVAGVLLVRGRRAR